MKKLRIALIVGGTSTEREVSKSSGAAIYSALLSIGHEVILVDPGYGLKQPEDSADFFCSEDYSALSNRNYVEAINSKLFDGIDVAMLALHGKWGEDGTIQSLLELRGIKYTGSKVLSSSISMDKIMSKILFNHYKVSTPEWFSMNKGIVNPDALSKMINNSFGYPCVIKPNDQGSTVGLTVCKTPADIPQAIELAFNYSDKMLLERFIEGYELTVGILENKALPVLEIKPKHDLYDYECKYTSGMSEYIVPADIPGDAAKNLQELSLLAFNSLGCEIYGRVDFRLDREYKPYCLEVNTLPGMTATSLVPKMAKAIGIPFEDLIDRILRLSLL
jgi:D-alanine-D-alanine ligase